MYLKHCLTSIATKVLGLLVLRKYSIALVFAMGVNQHQLVENNSLGQRRIVGTAGNGFWKPKIS